MQADERIPEGGEQDKKQQQTAEQTSPSLFEPEQQQFPTKRLDPGHLHRLADGAETPVPPVELGHRLGQVGGVEIGPIFIDKQQFGVGAFPQ